MQIKIQKTTDGKLLGAAIFLPADIMEPYKELEYIDLHPTIEDGGNLNLRIAPQIPMGLLNPMVQRMKEEIEGYWIGILRDRCWMCGRSNKEVTALCGKAAELQPVESEGMLTKVNICGICRGILK